MNIYPFLVIGNEYAYRSAVTLATIDQHVTDELKKISSNVSPRVRDGLLGPEEVKVTGAVLYDADRLGVSPNCH